MNLLIFYGFILGVILILLLVLISSYKKVAPNEVLIVTGACLSGPYVQVIEETNTRVKVVKGGGTFVIPILQRAEIESLDTFNIDVKVENIMTRDKVPVDASANAVLRVGSTPELIAIASEKILGLHEDERQNQMEQVVRGGLREVLSGLTPSEANDRGAFKDQVVSGIKDTFTKLGLEITAFQITQISDKNGYYESLSAKEIADKQSDARKARAEADKRASLVESQNRQESAKAKLEADKQIAQNERDTNVAKARYDAEVKREQEIATQAPLIVRAEQEEVLKEKQIAVKKNDLKATVIAEREAEAEAIKIQAEAEADSIRIQAEANAEKINKEGQAQAAAQKALADALQKNGQFALQKALIDNLPQIADSFASALANVDNLTVFDGAEGLGRQSTASLAQVISFIKQSTGIDLADYIDKKANGTITLSNPVPVQEK
ncbi:flotillin family protein [Campylobacter jejuni]|nr:flotillin family protein [Campylobacter jejuni]